jgi:hypothetical protein
MRSLVILLTLTLTGCAQYEAWERERAMQVSQNDDARCQSYGLQFGTAGYAQCRQNIDSQRQAAANAYIANQRANQPQPNMGPASPTVTNCQAYGSSINCQSSPGFSIPQSQVLPNVRF